jgi:formylmethanofuran dehydrogenase subunit C
MQQLVSTLAVAGLLAAAGGSAYAAKKCDVTGTWTDSLGTTLIMTTSKKGSATNTVACASAYKVKTTKLTPTIWDVKGTAKGCPTVTTDMTFQGGCNMVSGTITVQGLGSFDDAFTKVAGIRHAPRADAAIGAGLK